MVAFGRRVELTVIDRVGVGRRFTGNRVDFTVTRDRGSKPNRAEVKVYGLSPASRQLIKSEGAGVALLAGYPDDAGQIFQGDITSAFVEIEPPEVMTTIAAGDGQSQLLQRVSLSLVPGTSAEQAFQQIAAQMGVTVASRSRAVFPGVGPFYAFGSAESALDELVGRFGGAWSIQDGELVISEPTLADHRDAILISPETGLVGSPSVMTKKDGDVDMKGVKWKGLLNHRILPGSRCELDSRELYGFYVAHKVIHRGDTGFDNKFHTEVEAREL